MILGITRVYLDTYFLNALISKKQSEKTEARDEFKRLQSNPGSFDVVIPQIVLGEAFSTILRDYGNDGDILDMLNELCKYLKETVDVETCLQSLTVKTLEKARMLMDNDEFLKDTDAIIMAQVLLDPKSQRLLTHDSVLMKSRTIKDEEKRMRASGQRELELRVVDGISKRS